jgi:hypothetical protein
MTAVMERLKKLQAGWRGTTSAGVERLRKALSTLGVLRLSPGQGPTGSAVHATDRRAEKAELCPVDSPFAKALRRPWIGPVRPTEASRSRPGVSAHTFCYTLINADLWLTATSR